jgi:hypothetical protein
MIALPAPEELRFYILNGQEVVGPVGLMEWAAWFENGPRSVAYVEHDGVRVSTVFIGIGPLVIDGRDRGLEQFFETMIFGGEHDQHQDRCRTWDEAMAQHAAACDLAWPPTEFTETP